MRPARRRGGSVHLPPQQAELVALGVGQHNPGDLRRLANVDAPRPERKQPFQLGVLVSTGRVDVDVDAVFERLWLGHGHEHQRWRAAHLAADFNFALRPAIDHLIVEHPRPEVGHAPGVGAIDHQLREATSHSMLLGYEAYRGRSSPPWLEHALRTPPLWLSSMSRAGGASSQPTNWTGRAARPAQVTTRNTRSCAQQGRKLARLVVHEADRLACENVDELKLIRMPYTVATRRGRAGAA